MENPICNTVFDSRDLIEYKESLENELVEYWNAFRLESDVDIPEATEFQDLDLEMDDFSSICNAEIEHYKAIQKFCKELKSSPDFEYGEAIIHADHFEDYCRELVEDCGYISADFPNWIAVDWEQTAKNIVYDYSIASFGNEDYYIRS